MAANIMLIVEREFPYTRDIVFKAFTDPDELTQWRGRKGYHVPRDSIVQELKVGGRHHHEKVNDDDPNDIQITEAIFTEVFEPDVFVAKQRISGAPGVDPEDELELRAEFVKMGRSNTLVRIVQGPYDPSHASDYSDGWESELAKLSAYLDKKSGRR